MGNLHVRYAQDYYLLYKRIMTLFLTVTLTEQLITGPRNYRYKTDSSSSGKQCYRQASCLPPAVTASPRELVVPSPNSVSRLEKQQQHKGCYYIFVGSQHSALSETVPLLPEASSRLK